MADMQTLFEGAVAFANQYGISFEALEAGRPYRIRP